MAFCGKCGIQMGDGMRFCGSCGHDSNAAALAVQPQPKITAQAVTAPANPEESQWTAFARSVYHDVRKNGKFTGQQAPVTLSTNVAPGEKRIVQSHFIEYVFTGIGDGTPPERYSPTTQGVISALDSNAGTVYALSNAVITHQYRKAANPHWVEYERGELIVTDSSVIAKGNVHGIGTYQFSLILDVKMIAWNRIETVFLVDAKTHETFRVAFVSSAALVLFALWCLKYQPDHPQIMNW